MASQAEGKKRDQYLDALGLQEYTIVHFDIKRTESAVRWKLHRFLRGRTVERKLKSSVRVYRYPGLLHEGGFRVGQSVYMLPPELAGRLISKLRELRVSHRWWDVFSRG